VAIVRDASLQLEAAEMCGLIGRNGAGKTTLLRALMGALPASGVAELEGAIFCGCPHIVVSAHGIGYMPEDRRLVPDFTVEQNIRLPSLAVKLSASRSGSPGFSRSCPRWPGFPAGARRNYPAASRKWWHWLAH